MSRCSDDESALMKPPSVDAGIRDRLPGHGTHRTSHPHRPSGRVRSARRRLSKSIGRLCRHWPLGPSWWPDKSEAASVWLRVARSDLLRAVQEQSPAPTQGQYGAGGLTPTADLRSARAWQKVGSRGLTNNPKCFSCCFRKIVLRF